MKYKNPNVESSYHQNDIGLTLYNLVLELKPKKIVEFGTLNGYSAICMGMALHEIGFGKIYCYDLWDEYKYKHTTIDFAKKNIKEYGLEDYVELNQMNIWDWGDYDFDLLHIDISNDGDIIKKLCDKIGGYISDTKKTVIFEGGSEERDNIEWMLKYDKKPINDIKKEIPYEVINKNFPSLSILK